MLAYLQQYAVTKFHEWATWQTAFALGGVPVVIGVFMILDRIFPSKKD